MIATAWKNKKTNCQMILQVLGRDNWKENLLKAVSISPPLSSQEKQKSSIEHTFGTQGNEKI